MFDPTNTTMNSCSNTIESLFDNICDIARSLSSSRILLYLGEHKVRYPVQHIDNVNEELFDITP